jgi:polysaccharide biosynthesis protein PslH
LNILIITPRIPYPPYRGDKLKIFNLAKVLSIKNSVKIVSFHNSVKDFSLIEELKKHKLEIITVKHSLFNSLVGIFSALFINIPFQVAFFKSKKMFVLLENITKNEKFDVIYFHLIRSAQYLDSTESNTAIKILDFTDAVSLYLSRYVEVIKNPLRKFLVKIELRRIKEYESIANKFHTLFVCSDKDRNFISEHHKKLNIQILNNGIDVDSFIPDDTKFNPNRIIFTGNMPYFANYDAVIYFAKKIFPGIVKEIPNAEFYIVGQKPPFKVRKLSTNNIIVTGYVADIKKEYLLSGVNVAPIRFGAGTLNKILESLALGVPVVATPMAVEGMPSELKRFIFLANNPQEFIEKVIYVLKNPQLRKGLLDEGRKTIINLLSWKQIIGNFEIYLNQKIIE